jgi:hypothetical protein
MEHLEKLIPLAVLLGVAAFLVMLLRRATRETNVVAAAKEPEPVVVVVMPQEAPVAVEPAPVETPVEAVVEDAPTPIIKPRRPASKRRVRAGKTPVQSVLAMLHDKDALAKAFLLREILAPPVSRRQ